MKLAFPLPHMMRIKAITQPWEAGVTGADQTRLVKQAEALGYDMIAVPEHHVIPREHVELSGPHHFHAAAAQAYIAGATETIRVNSCVTLLPLQNPIVLAKALATMDWLSSGRVTATFGVGWLKGEFDLIGVPFHERGRIADEYLQAMIALWTQEAPEFEGRYVSFRDVAFEPKPVQKPHVPIWMGGDAEPVLKRAARFATGWWPTQTRPEDIPARIDFIKSQPTFGGGPFEVMYGVSSARLTIDHKPLVDPESRPELTAQEILDQLGWLGELGVTMSSVPVPPAPSLEAFLDHVQWVAEEIRPKLG